MWKNAFIECSMLAKQFILIHVLILNTTLVVCCTQSLWHPENEQVYYCDINVYELELI